MKVLILGADGLLGHTVLRTLCASASTVGGTVRGSADTLTAVPSFTQCEIFDHLDLTNEAALEQCLASFRPEVVINCAGIVKQRAEASDLERLFATNSKLPRLVEAHAEQLDFRFIQVSTDCVFAGTKGHYTETDPADATDAYGKSKHEGESYTSRSLTIRTSFIGRQLRGESSLLEWMLNTPDTNLTGYSNSFFSGLSAQALAREIEHVIHAMPNLSGLYHLSGPRISKHELLTLINQKFDCKKKIALQSTPQLDRSLDDRRYRAITATAAPSWPEMLDEILDDSAHYGEWRTAILKASTGQSS